MSLENRSTLDRRWSLRAMCTSGWTSNGTCGSSTRVQLTTVLGGLGLVIARRTKMEVANGTLTLSTLPKTHGRLKMKSPRQRAPSPQKKSKTCREKKRKDNESKSWKGKVLEKLPVTMHARSTSLQVLFDFTSRTGAGTRASAGFLSKKYRTFQLSGSFSLPQTVPTNVLQTRSAPSKESASATTVTAATAIPTALSKMTSAKSIPVFAAKTLNASTSSSTTTVSATMDSPRTPTTLAAPTLTNAPEIIPAQMEQDASTLLA